MVEACNVSECVSLVRSERRKIEIRDLPTYHRNVRARACRDFYRHLNIHMLYEHQYISIENCVCARVYLVEMTRAPCDWHTTLRISYIFTDPVRVSVYIRAESVESCLRCVYVDSVTVNNVQNIIFIYINRKKNCQ